MRCALRLAVLAMVGVLVSGCAGGGGDAVPSSASSAAAAAPGAAATATEVRVEAPTIAKETFAGPAVSKYGQSQVQAAYQDIAQFSAAETLNPARIGKAVDQVTEADLASPAAYMTAGAAKSWEVDVAGRGDLASEASGNLYGIAYYGLNNVQYKLRTDVSQPGVTVTNSEVSLDSDGVRLKMALDVNGSIRYVSRDGQYAQMKVDKTVTYWLVKGSGKDKPWLIDGWQTQFRTDQVAPDVR